MLSKILVGITGLALVGVGGFLYYDHNQCPSRNGCCKNNITQTATLPCCQQPTEITTSTSSEELTVMPREVVQ